jgi:hypothetical protein
LSGAVALSLKISFHRQRVSGYIPFVYLGGALFINNKIPSIPNVVDWARSREARKPLSICM